MKQQPQTQRPMRNLTRRGPRPRRKGGGPALAGDLLAALLAGARVRVERDALEYRRYRRTAPLGIYQKCAGLERRLREMGICVAGTGGR